MQTVDINTKYKIPRSIKLLHFEAGSLLIGAEFHSVEMSASGRHLCVWRVVCPTTETYYISVHTHTHTHTCVYTLSYCPTADVFYSRAGNAAGTQWSGGLDSATGEGGSPQPSLPAWQDWQTSSKSDEITHWLIGCPARYKYQTPPHSHFTNAKGVKTLFEQKARITTHSSFIQILESECKRHGTRS